MKFVILFLSFLVSGSFASDAGTAETENLCRAPSVIYYCTSGNNGDALLKVLVSDAKGNIIGHGTVRNHQSLWERCVESAKAANESVNVAKPLLPKRKT